jgi:hypothetical protein
MKSKINQHRWEVGNLFDVPPLGLQEALFLEEEEQRRKRRKMGKHGVCETTPSSLLLWPMTLPPARSRRIREETWTSLSTVSFTFFLVAFCLEKKILLCRELTGGKEGRNGAVGSAVYILGALATRAQPFVWFFSAGFGLSRANKT